MEWLPQLPRRVRHWCREALPHLRREQCLLRALLRLCATRTVPLLPSPDGGGALRVLCAPYEPGSAASATFCNKSQNPMACRTFANSGAVVCSLDHVRLKATFGWLGLSKRAHRSGIVRIGGDWTLELVITTIAAVAGAFANWLFNRLDRSKAKKKLRVQREAIAGLRKEVEGLKRWRKRANRRLSNLDGHHDSEADDEDSEGEKRDDTR